MPVLPRTAVLAAAAFALAGPAAAQSAADTTAITRVTVFDAAAGRHRADQTVLIAGGRIVRVDAADAVRVPPRARVVDGRGRFLLPGLWDMHVHLSVPGGEALLPLYPVNGVTGVRDMNDSFPEVAAWRRRIVAGELIGPRIVASGPYLVGAAPPLPHLRVTSAADGRAGVDSLRRLGVDFVKVHNEIPRDGYLAIAARVRELGWIYAGHVPRSVTVAEAADAGQRSLEHFTGFVTSCAPGDLDGRQVTPVINFLLGPCDGSDQGPTIARLRANGTWVTPTLYIQGTIGRGGEPAAVDTTARYRSEALRQLQTVVMRLPPMTPEALATAGFLYGKRRELVARLDAAGVPLLVGTDAPTPGTFPGFAIHDELAALVESGLSPARALQGATIEPARYFAALDSTGTVEAGKVADLVLLEADPLANIAATRRISAVWVGGRLINQATRTALLAAAERAAQAGK